MAKKTSSKSKKEEVTVVPKKAIVVIIDMVDGTQKSKLVNDNSEDNSLTSVQVATFILNEYNQYIVNEQSGDPIIKAIRVFRVTDDYEVFDDLDLKFLQTKEKYLNDKNNVNVIQKGDQE